MVGYGAPGQPDSPLEEDGGAPKRGRGVQQHATSSMPFESFMMHTGDCLVDAKGSGEEGRETPTKPRGPRKNRMGHRSPSVGKPRTSGWELTAKAPRLWKDGNKGTQRTRKLSTGNALWSWSNGNRRFMEVHAERPQVLRRVR